jgi:hypothetical protein
MSFTIFHWIAIAVFVLIFLILLLISLKQDSKKMVYSMIFSALLVSILGGVVSIFVLEKYTKKAKILSYDNRRNLSTESIIFTGQIKNIGRFDIGYCEVEVKLTNNVKAMGRPKNAFFKPSNSLSDLFSSKESKPNVVKESFVVAKNIRPSEIKRFRIKMRYPPYFNNTAVKLSLNCH